MSILVRDRNGKGCVELPPEERHGSVPVTVRDKAGRPPDLDLFTRALEDEWDVPPQVKADVVSRLHAVVKYINDPRAVVRAGNALIRATESNHRGREVALRVVQQQSPGVRKYDLESLKEPEPERPTAIRKRAEDAAIKAWDDAKALGYSERDCDLACLGMWAQTWEAAGYPAPPAPWSTEKPDR